MRIAIFSDVHANLPALESVLEEIDRRRPDMVFCLGDLVGYGPWPNEVIDLIRSRRIATVAGNYDDGVGRNSDDCGCAYRTDEDRSRGAASIEFTNRIITNERRQYLRALPRHLRLEFATASVLMVHGSPRRINEYLFEDRPEESLLRMMRAAEADVMLFGHTHKPYHRVLEDESDGRARVRHAINTGSVGKPKDGDPRACLVMLEWEGGELRADGDGLRVEFVRVRYDVERAAQAIERGPLPDAFAAMLRSGS